VGIRAAAILACLSLSLIQPPACAAAPSTVSTLPRVEVFNFANSSGQASLDAACAAASSSLALTLRQMGGYEVLPSEQAPQAVNADYLRAWAEGHGADFVLFGSLEAPQPGRYACSLSLFDRARGLVTITKRSPPASIMDIFDAMDDLVANLIDSMAGRHIGFGRVDFVNRGEKGDYRVTMDGIEAGSNLSSLGKVLAGEHGVRVVQRRMLGELELARRTIRLGEGESAEVEFSLPAITSEEKERLETLEAEIRAGMKKAEAREKVDGKLAELVGLLGKAGSGPAFEDYRRRAFQLSGEWKLAVNRREIEARAWNPTPGLFDPGMAIYLDAASYQDPGAIRDLAGENALLLASLLELKAGGELAAGEAAAGLVDFEGILGLSRCLPEQMRLAYAGAVAGLAEAVAGSGSRIDPASLEAHFGPSMRAGLAFKALAEGAGQEARRPILVSSDSGAIFSLPGERKGAPFALEASSGQASLPYSSRGSEGRLALDGATDSRAIVYADIGPSDFGFAYPGSGKPAAKAASCRLYIDADASQGGLVEVELLRETSGERAAFGAASPGSSLSATLEAGKYRIAARLPGDEEAAYQGELEVAGDGPASRSIQLPRVEWSKAHRVKLLEAEKAAAVAKREKARGAGSGGAQFARFTLWTGLISSGVCLVSYVVGSGAYSNYSQATDESTATSSRAQAEQYSMACSISGGIAGGFLAISGLSGLLSRGKADPALDRAIGELDRQIKELGATGGSK
jgi:hypothetical protein